MKVGDIVYISGFKYVVYSFDTYGVCLMNFATGDKTTCWFQLDEKTMDYESKPDNVEWLEIKRLERQRIRKVYGGAS